jgi:hypothetical protein
MSLFDLLFLITDLLFLITPLVSSIFSYMYMFFDF